MNISQPKKNVVIWAKEVKFMTPLLLDVFNYKCIIWCKENVCFNVFPFA